MILSQQYAGIKNSKYLIITSFDENATADQADGINTKLYIDQAMKVT
jgi:hypothetical protein